MWLYGQENVNHLPLSSHSSQSPHPDKQKKFGEISQSCCRENPDEMASAMHTT
jgi:hypothetical protein